MSAWYAPVIRILRQSGLFTEVHLQGGKVRAVLSDSRFLDIHFDPTTSSYSYALIDLTLTYAGDKRLFGWDDFPHPDQPALHALSSHPHHFQERLSDGRWQFSASPFRGNVEKEIVEVLKVMRRRLK